MFKKLHHTSIICSDYDKAVKFYVDTLGLELFRESTSETKKGPKLELYHNGQYFLELFISPIAAKTKRNGVFTGLDHLSFLVEDCDKAAEYLKSKGVEITDVMTDLSTHKKYAFFYDPDGQKLEIYNE